MGIAESYMVQLSILSSVVRIDLGDIGSNVKVRAVVVLVTLEYVGSNDLVTWSSTMLSLW